MKNLLRQIKNSKIELSKVFFPTFNEIKKYLTNVMIVVILMAIYLTIVDNILQKIVNYIIF